MRQETGLINVLLVDDDSLTHEMLGLLLRQTEFSLRSAMNVAEAMSLIAADTPDIIITDAMMPGESGFSLIEKVKSNLRTENIPVILWTIMEKPDGSVMDASGKADISVSKPLYLSDIMSGLEMAKQLIERRKIAKTSASPADEIIEVII